MVRQSVYRNEEFNGLRVLMALINNWDLKDVNNAIYMEPNGVTYVVADLGATFGHTGSALQRSKGNAKDYTNTAFIRKVMSDHIDFQLASRPLFIQFLTNSHYTTSEQKWRSRKRHTHQ